MDNDGWISVDERLPDNQEPVLIWPPANEFFSGPDIAWYDYDEDMPGWHAPDIFDEPDPTHWRPLPAPPKKAEAARDIQHTDTCPITAARKIVEDTQ